MASIQSSNYDNDYLPNNIGATSISHTGRGEADLLRTLELFLEQGSSYLDDTVKQSIVYVLQYRKNPCKNKKDCQQLIISLNRSLDHTGSKDLYYLKQNLIRLLKSIIRQTS